MSVANQQLAEPASPTRGRWRRTIRLLRLPSARARILGWFVVLLGLALVFGLVLQRSILLSQLDSDIDDQLVQEIEELQQLTDGRNPADGEPFGANVEAIFETFLGRNVPAEGEALYTIVGGEPFASTAGAPLQLLDDPEVLERWATVETSTRGSLQTAAGEVRYAAIPLSFNGEVAGVFVVTIFMESRLADVNRVLQTGAFVFGATLLVASVLAWVVAGRVLRPVRLLTDAARSISDDNWRERIPVRGDDEIVELTRTFNEMLDRLETAFATQRQFVDDAGHELRTPITIVRGHLELLGDDPAEREETMRLVDDELDRMARIVDDLLLLAKFEATDFLVPAAVDIAELTEELRSKSSALGDRVWEVDEVARLTIIADRQRITQAVMNLARNAVEHTTPGARVSLGSQAAGAYVHLWVTDTGSGIAPDEQERIFQRFARGRDGTRTSGGAGLGLAIVRAIAEAHGGRVELQSALGAGSRFTLILPIEGPGKVPQ